MLEFYGPDIVKKAEKGDFKVFIGGDSECADSVSFRLV